MKKTIAIFLVLLLAIFGSIKVAKFFVPPSIEVYFAALSGCDIDEEALAKEDPQFEKIKWWEHILMRVYRIEQMYFTNEFVVSDFVVQNSSVYHLLLVASDETQNSCDQEVFALLNRYNDQGAPINHFNEQGLTALQDAVISRNKPFVEILLASGANPNLKTQIKGSSISNMSSIEIAEFFISKNAHKQEFGALLEAMKNEI